jgi:SAM-dependent methyltransferase
MEGGAYAEMYELEDRHWWFRGRRELIWALLGLTELAPEPRILDAGCGTGRNLVEFGKLGTAAGMDPSEDAVDYCKKRGLANVQCGVLESLPFEADAFDILLACDVLEHVYEDSVALNELFRVADRGANLVITAPAYRWMWTEHDVQLHHFRRYTLGELKRRVTAAGWRTVHATYFNSILLPGIAGARAVSRLSPRRGHTDLDRTPGVLNGLLVRPLRLEARMISRGVRLPAGVSVAMVCKKPE